MSFKIKETAIQVDRLQKDMICFVLNPSSKTKNDK